MLLLHNYYVYIHILSYTINTAESISQRLLDLNENSVVYGH